MTDTRLQERTIAWFERRHTLVSAWLVGMFTIVGTVLVIALFLLIDWYVPDYIVQNAILAVLLGVVLPIAIGMIIEGTD